MQYNGLMLPEGTPYLQHIECYILSYCRDVTDQMLLLLRKAGHTYTTSAEKEIVRIIKEKTCYVSLNPHKEERDGIKAEDFVLPDGQIIKVTATRFSNAAPTNRSASNSWERSVIEHQRFYSTRRLSVQSLTVYMK